MMFPIEVTLIGMGSTPHDVPHRDSPHGYVLPPLKGTHNDLFMTHLCIFYSLSSYPGVGRVV